MVVLNKADAVTDIAEHIKWVADDAGYDVAIADSRRDPDDLLGRAREVPGESPTVLIALDGGGRIARYAVGRDYHRALGNAVAGMRVALEKEGVPRGTIKIGTDSVPLLERSLATRAGIGFLAKSSGVISPTLGPYLLLAEALVPVASLPELGR